MTLEKLLYYIESGFEVYNDTAIEYECDYRQTEDPYYQFRAAQSRAKADTYKQILEWVKNQEV